MNELRVIAITHKNFSLEEIGLFHLNPDSRGEILQNLKTQFGFSELMYLSTCNRVEIIFSLPHYVCPGLTAQIIQALQPSLSGEVLKSLIARADRYNELEAAEHLLRVASGLESLVIGEREIITQLRKAYEDALNLQLTGDNLRLIINQCVKTAKEIFTNTDLSKKPVSVVSLAWQKFIEFGVARDKRILLIGAGQIIRNFAKFIMENEFFNVTLVNRTIQNAQTIANTFPCPVGVLALNELRAAGEFDVLVSCTASQEHVFRMDDFESMGTSDASKKLIIDLSIPADVENTIVETYNISYVDMHTIQQIAGENIQFRKQAIEECEPIIESGIRDFERTCHERRIENAMRSIPETIREIKNTAMGNVFAKDLEKLDDESKEIIEKILGYMEKKYISVPMKMAREVLLDVVHKN